MYVLDGDDIRREMAKMGKALKAHGDGKAIKREASKRLRKIVQPAAAKMKAAVRSLPSKGHPGASAREAVARQTRAATRWSGKNAGAGIVQRGRGMPRGFNMVGRMFNRAAGWSPTRLGGEVEHQEMRPSGWFDDNTIGLRREAHAEMISVLDDVAGRIARDAGR